MLHPFGPEEEPLSLPWFLTQQLSYSSNRSSTLEVELCWLFGGLLLSQIMENNSTNGSVRLLQKNLNICRTLGSSPRIKHMYIYGCLGSSIRHQKWRCWICWCGSMFIFWWTSSSNCVSKDYGLVDHKSFSIGVWY